MLISSHELLQHILDEILFIEKEISNLGKVKFLCDEKLKRACVRSLEIIGEAAKKLPADFKEKHHGNDWKAMAGMRDKLIHDYFGIDYDIVWDVIENKIPQLSERVQKILAKK